MQLRTHALPALFLALLPAAAIAHSPAEQRVLALAQDDPMAVLYVVTSQSTFDAGVSALTTSAVARRDSTGKPLVVARVRAHQLEDISRHVHEREKRCGGYFAFDTQAEADAFIRNDQSARAMSAPALVTYTIDNAATVNPWLGQVQESRIRSTITHLSTQYRNRYYTTATGQQSAQWIRDTWLALGNGRNDVSAELFNCANCSTQPSVILTVQGAELPNEIVVLGGHLDSVSNSGSGSTMNAPGADDDASGIATLTEVIRIALGNGWRPKRTVKFMGYAAEEVGLRGSNAIAQSFKTANRNVVGVLQLDMTNYRTGALDMKVITDYSNAPLKQFMTDVFDAYLAPTGLTRGTYTCGYGCSDHASWTSAGYPATMMFESGNFPSIHTANDTLANTGGTANSSVPFARLGLSFLGELAKTAGSGGNAPPVANFTFSGSGLTVAFTNTSTDSDGTIATRSWNFGDGTTSTVNSPSRTYAAAGTYTVTLTVTDDDGATNSKSAQVTVGTTSGRQTYSNATDYTIRDNATVESPVSVSGRSGNGPTDASVSVTILHSYKGDLKVDLVAPDGTLYNIHNRSGGSADNVAGTFTRNVSTEALNGTWRLRVNDNASYDTGRIDTWSINF